MNSMLFDVIYVSDMVILLSKVSTSGYIAVFKILLETYSFSNRCALFGLIEIKLCFCFKLMMCLSFSRAVAILKRTDSEKKKGDEEKRKKAIDET